MYYFLLYTFITAAVLSSIIIVFFNGSRLSTLTVFILSVSGILSLINAGYIAFILIFSSLLYYIIKKVKQEDEILTIDNGSKLKFTGLFTASLFGAVLASIAGSNLWQGKTILYKEITASGIADLAVYDYYVMLLLIFSAFPLLSLLLKKKNG